MKKHILALALTTLCLPFFANAASIGGAIVEVAPFTIKQGVTETQLMKASDSLNIQFLEKQRGYIKRELLDEGDRRYLDIIHWATKEDAQAALRASETCQPCSQFFELMEMANTANPSDGVKHMRSVASWKNGGK
ncbi:MAG: antibiotic biosynthesis monooxygenase family protein [Bacteroidota bacterium]